MIDDGGVMRPELTLCHDISRAFYRPTRWKVAAGCNTNESSRRGRRSLELNARLLAFWCLFLAYVITSHARSRKAKNAPRDLPPSP